jgi:hypothetical protein
MLNTSPFTLSLSQSVQVGCYGIRGWGQLALNFINVASLVREKVQRIMTVKKKIKAMLEEGTPRKKHRRRTVARRG